MSGQWPKGHDVEPARITVTEGQVLELPVEDLVSGGYVWDFAAVPEGLRQLPEESTPGSPRRRLRLRADRAGAYRVDLELRRPWEPPDLPPAARRSLELRVDPSGEG